MNACLHCGFPITDNDTGCRHYGDRIAHNSARCHELMRERITELEKHIRNMDQARMERDEEVKKLKQQKEALCRQLLIAADAVNREAGFTGIAKALGITEQQPSQLHNAKMICTECGDTVSTPEVWEVWDHSCGAFVWFACRKCQKIGTMRFVMEKK